MQHKIAVTLFLLALFSASAIAETVTVTVRRVGTNPGYATKVSYASTPDLPDRIGPRDSKSARIYAFSGGSHIYADYKNSTATGGCKFDVQHTMNAIGPVYSSSAQGYGAVDNSLCKVYLNEKWSAPYNYSAEFTMYF